MTSVVCLGHKSNPFSRDLTIPFAFKASSELWDLAELGQNCKRMSHEFPRSNKIKCDRSVRDRALPVHVQILKIFSEGGEGPAHRPDWVQIQTLENRKGSGPPLPTPLDPRMISVIINQIKLQLVLW